MGRRVIMLSMFVCWAVFFVGLTQGGMPLWEMVVALGCGVLGVLWLAWDGVTRSRQEAEEEEEERQREKEDRDALFAHERELKRMELEHQSRKADDGFPPLLPQPQHKRESDG